MRLICVSIIVLSLMSNLLSTSKTIELLIWFKYYHLVDWWRRFEEINQQDVTKLPSGKVDLWLCNEVQESVKTVITQCIDDPWKGTLRKIRKTKPRKKLVGAE